MTVDNFVSELENLLPIRINKHTVVSNNITGYHAITINRLRFQVLRMEGQYSWGLFLAVGKPPISIYGDNFESTVREFIKRCSESTFLHYLTDDWEDLE